jgi:hypothetical protein
MSPLKLENVTHRREYPEMKTSNSEVMVSYSNGRGASQRKRIALTGLAAFILNSVNQPSTPLVEQGQDNE